MAPEQARGEQADARCDLFSLGAVLYFMATGHPPFRAEQAMAVLHRICHDRHRPVYQINPTISDELASIIDRLPELSAELLAKDPLACGRNCHGALRRYA